MTLAVDQMMVRRYFAPESHPYRLFEAEIARRLTPGTTLLEAGCGATAPLLKALAPRVAQAIGVDILPPNADGAAPNVRLMCSDLRSLAVDSESVDLVISRSVLEHLLDPLAAFREICRVLKPGGEFVALTPNLWHYSALVAWLIPNRFHSRLVRATEGRDERDVFPTCYRCNSKGAIERLAGATGFSLVSLTYLTQYPNYFLFSRPLFALASHYEKLVARLGWLRPLSGWLLVVLRKPGEVA